MTLATQDMARALRFFRRLEGRWRGAPLSAEATPCALAELIGLLAELPLRRRARRALGEGGK